jgi:hypothetical protein
MRSPPGTKNGSLLVVGILFHIKGETDPQQGVRETVRSFSTACESLNCPRTRGLSQGEAPPRPWRGGNDRISAMWADKTLADEPDEPPVPPECQRQTARVWASRPGTGPVLAVVFVLLSGTVSPRGRRVRRGSAPPANRQIAALRARVKEGSEAVALPRCLT